MLPNVNILAANILALPKTTDKMAGMTGFTRVIADFMDQVQASSEGSVGIFALAQSIVIPLLAALPLVADNSWIPGFADALEAGIINAIITPSTVTDRAWGGSAFRDTLTLPTGAATITTISAAKAILISELASATYSNNPPVPFAQAIMDCTLAFIFNCIGLGPSLTPVPIPMSAE